MVIEAMKEALLLMPMHRQVGRIQIDDDLLRSFPMRFQKQADQQLVDRFTVVVDLLVCIHIARFPAQFQPVHRAFPRQWAILRFIRKHAYHGIGP